MIRFLLYGLFGWCVEIVWTAGYAVAAAVADGRRPDPRLEGHTYLWMLLVYGAGGMLFEIAHAVLAPFPWPLRGTVYMLGCFAVEYATGWLIKTVTGTIPWDYSAHRWQVHGLIRLDYAPAWFVFGFVLEQVESIVRSVEPVLRGL